MKKVLFVCKHNRFRSKVAEAFFNKFVRENGKKAVCESVGFLLDLKSPFVAGSVKLAVEKRGAKILRDEPRQITLPGIEGFDLIVCLTDSVNKDFFCDRAPVEIWNIDDTSADDFEGIERIVENIEIKVEDLVKTKI